MKLTEKYIILKVKKMMPYYIATFIYCDLIKNIILSIYFIISYFVLHHIIFYFINLKYPKFEISYLTIPCMHYFLDRVAREFFENLAKFYRLFVEKYLIK